MGISEEVSADENSKRPPTARRACEQVIPASAAIEIIMHSFGSALFPYGSCPYSLDREGEVEGYNLNSAENDKRRIATAAL